MSDIVRLYRIIEYIGDRQWIEDTLDKSIKGEMDTGNGNKIIATTLGSFPEKLNDKQPEKK